MARCPFAIWKPAGTPGGAITPRVAILHVAAVEGMIAPHDGLEWHFYIRYDGSIVQVVDTNQRADANYHANPFAVSIETEGLAAGSWTEAQIRSILRLLRWLNTVHPIPLRRCDRWDGAGIGHHTMWGAPSQWTPVAKSCPGPARKVQFDTIILPALAGPTPRGFLMALTDQQQQELYDRVVAMHTGNWVDSAGHGDLKWLVTNVRAVVQDEIAKLTPGGSSSSVDAGAVADAVVAKLRALLAP